MRKTFQKLATANLVVVMLAAAITPAAAAPAKNNQQVNKKAAVQIGLKDVGSHWAKQNVQMLNIQGVIKGYSDGTFQPERKVTQAEAIVMAVRMMGLSDQAAARMNASLPFTDSAAIPKWATGYIAIALDKGLIEANGVFQPQKAATRLYCTELLVRTLSLETNQQTIEAQVRFTDTTNLGVQDRNCIALAVMNRLMNGYEDKSFRPNRPVTRAELATLMARAQEWNRIGQNTQIVTGILLSSSVQDSSLSVQTAVYDAVYGNPREITVAPDATIYRDKKSATLADLQPQDHLVIVLNSSNQAIFIDAKSQSEVVTEETLNGTITKIDAANNSIKLLLSGIIEVQYAVASDAAITRDGQTVKLADLQVNDKVTMLQNEQGLIYRITARAGRPDIAINLVEKLQIKAAGSGARITLEQQVKNGALVCKMELLAPKKKLVLTGEQAQEQINKILVQLNLSSVSTQEEVQAAVANVFGPILGTPVTSYQIKIEGPDRQLTVAQNLAGTTGDDKLETAGKAAASAGAAEKEKNELKNQIKNKENKQNKEKDELDD